MNSENTEMYQGVQIQPDVLPIVETLKHIRSLGAGAQSLSAKLEQAGIRRFIDGLEHLTSSPDRIILCPNHWTATSDKEKSGKYNVVTIMHSVGVMRRALEIGKPDMKLMIALSEAPRHQAVIDETFGTQAWYREYQNKIATLGREKFYAYTAANTMRKIHLAAGWLAGLNDVVVSPNLRSFTHVTKFIRTVEKVFTKNNRALLIFPQEDASPTLLPAEGGAEYLSRKLNIPIVPVAMWGDGDGFHVRIAPAMHIPNDASRKGRDAFNVELMTRIAVRLPERFRGVYSESANSSTF